MLPVLPAADRPRVMIVLGMHRSGTSLLSGVLHYLGCDMADTSDAISDKNPGGFWERPEIVTVHDEILEALGRPLSAPSHLLPFPARWWRRKEVQALKPKLVEIARHGIGANPAGIWGFKDPRACRMIPLWDEILEGFGVDPIYVHAIRAPAEAARSMSLKNPKLRPFTDAQTELMWLVYNYEIMRNVGVRPISIVDYDDWFTRPEEAAGSLIDLIGGNFDRSEVSDILADFVNGDFRHHKTEGGARARPTIASTFYDALLKDRDHGQYQFARQQTAYLELFFRSVEPLVQHLATFKLMSNHPVAAVAQGDATGLGNTLALDPVRTTTKGLADTLDDVLASTKSLVARNAAVLDAIADREATMREASALRAEAASLEKRNAALSTRIVDLELSARDAQLAADKTVALTRSAADRDMGKLKALLKLRRRKVMGSLRKVRAQAQDIAAARSDAAIRQRGYDQRGREVDAALRRASDIRAAHDAQATELAAARRALAESTLPAADWWARTAAPDAAAVDSLMELDVSLRSTTAGIEGRILLENDPATPLLIEAKVDDAGVATVSTATSALEGETGLFRLDWNVLPASAAGRIVALHVVGEGAPFATFLVPAVLPNIRPRDESGDAERYTTWIAQYDRLIPADRERARSYLADHQNWPTLSVVLYGDSPDPTAIAASAKSIREQLYDRWELIVCGDYQDNDERIRRIDIDGDLHAVIAEASGSHVCFVEAGDLLAEQALLMLADVVRSHRSTGFVYSDEDRIDASTGERIDPYFKGAPSLDLLLQSDYLTRAALVPTGFARDHATGPISGASIHRLALSAIAEIKPGDVRHVPQILYHRDATKSSIIDPDTIRSALQANAWDADIGTDERGRWNVVWPLPDPAPRVSLIVPTRDRVDLLRPCVDGFLRDTAYPDLEVVVVDNGSTDPETLSYLKSVSRESRVKLLRWPGEFDFSAINKHGVDAATGSIIGLMNNDLKVIGEYWLDEMVRHALRPDVGAVGARLLYGDGSLQHAGIVMGIGVASHRYRTFPADHGGQDGSLHRTQDVTAVTAACLVMRREIWDEVGGLAADLPVAYNDVDLCLKVRAAGYRVIYEPGATLYHLESQSRGYDTDGEKRERLKREQAKLVARWPVETRVDPFYNPNLTLKQVDYGLAFPPRAKRPWDV